MNRVYKYLWIIILGCNSCFQEDSPMAPIKPGSIETVQIEIGYPYVNQVYYDCGTNKVIRTHSKYEWDLAFDCNENGHLVRLNTAKGEFVANMGNVLFSSVNSVKDVKWRWDAPSGATDSTGIGDWRKTGNVYILDLQYDAFGQHLGYKKFQIQEVSKKDYTFKYADLNGDNEQTYVIQKNPNLNYIHFSFANGGQTLRLEPNKDSWDLLFTNHYHKFSNLPLPFVLTQVLINSVQGVEVAEDNQDRFSEMVLNDTLFYSYSNLWDVIGYDWKIRNSQDNSFIINPKKSFILRTTERIYYKVRFTDFYNENGDKGYPTFEIQKL